MPDVRFWDHTQSEFYRNIPKKKPENRVVHQKWINWVWMASKQVQCLSRSGLSVTAGS